MGMDFEKIIKLIDTETIRVKEKLNSIKLDYNNPIEYLKSIFKVFVDNQCDLLIDIIHNKNLYDMSIIDFEKNNILSIFDEIQEMYYEIYKLFKPMNKPMNINRYHVIVEVLFEIIDILHFVIQHYILNELKRRGSTTIDIELISSELFRNNVTNIIVLSFVEEFHKRINDEYSMFNSIDIFHGSNQYELIKHGIFNIKQFYKLAIIKDVETFNDLYIKLNFRLSQILDYVNWKHWKMYIDTGFKTEVFRDLSGFLFDLYYIYMKVMYLMYMDIDDSNYPEKLKEFNNMILTINNGSLLESMLVVYLYKNMENFNRQERGY